MKTADVRRPGRALTALLAGLAMLAAGLLAGQTVDPRPRLWAGLVVDRLSTSLALLVAGVGLVTLRFSTRYLDGDPGRRAFLARLAMTVVAAYVLMMSDHLLLLFVAWSVTSLGLHGLLTHEPDRPEALRPARKKFLISRLGDIALLGAIVAAGLHWGTLSVSGLLGAVGQTAGDGPATAAVALLVAVAALTKSAQFPFHSWLPETMESPTPVSALMHAGIINAGGALLLRFAPLLARVPAALLVLAAVGSVTVALGLTSMWAQVKVKRTLAWSTVGQMGFMMVQCGLAAFPAAWLHILGHGLYKAWSFLRTGDVPTPGPVVAPIAPARTMALALLGTALGVPAIALASWATGFSPGESPGELALAAILALSIGQLWVALLRAGAVSAPRVVGALGATAATALAAIALYRGAGEFLAPVLGDRPSPRGPAAWAAAALPLAVVAALTVLHAVLPVLGRGRAGRALYVHALNGFYFGAIADRLVERAWPTRSRAAKGVQGA